MIKNLTDRIDMMFKKWSLSKQNHSYKIDEFYVNLGKEHNLPLFQNVFPMYDRFLPFLVDEVFAASGGVLKIG